MNSGKNVYQLTPEALALLQKYGTEAWAAALKAYLATIGTLKDKYAQRRKMERIPVKIGEGNELSLSPGGQNVLVKVIIDKVQKRRG